MKTLIIDNWLNKDLVNYLENYFLYNFPHHYGHKSNEDETEKCFYSTELNASDALNNYLFVKLKKTLNLNLELKRMYINIQHEKMNRK